MIEEVYNILKSGKTVSCAKVAEKLGCSQEIVLAILDYLKEKNIVKKELIGSVTCSGKCNKCSFKQENITYIWRVCK